MIITDTGFWLALRNKKDKHHRRALACVEKYSIERFVTTWPVIVETFYLLMSRLSYEDALDFIQALKMGAFDVMDLHQSNIQRIEILCEKYRDLPMDLADASLVILAERLDHGKILSTDERDFKTYEWKHRKLFKNLMF